MRRTIMNSPSKLRERSNSMAFKKNIGVADRVVRIVIGIALLAITSLAIVGPGNPLAYLGLVGLIPLTAGIIGYCPPYSLLGKNTYTGHQ
jgi:hypothetical protein